LIIWSIIGTGISSVTTQLLTIREFLNQFQGNEITISLVLFSWFLLTGLGSLAAKAVKRPFPGLYTFLILIIAIWPLLQLVVIRVFKETFLPMAFHPVFIPPFSTFSSPSPLTVFSSVSSCPMLRKSSTRAIIALRAANFI